MSLTFEVYSKFMFGVREASDILRVNSESFQWTACAQGIVSTCPVAHAERCIPVTVVVVEHGRQDSILPVVHAADLGFVEGGA